MVGRSAALSLGSRRSGTLGQGAGMSLERPRRKGHAIGSFSALALRHPDGGVPGCFSKAESSSRCRECSPFRFRLPRPPARTGRLKAGVAALPRDQEEEGPPWNEQPPGEGGGRRCGSGLRRPDG
jgi:hypothetical protein